MATNEWIACRDSLPEDTRIVIVLCFFSGKPLVDVGFHDGDKWNLSANLFANCVGYWCPLPPCPADAATVDARIEEFVDEILGTTANEKENEFEN